ncbi:unnamed protein product, partial [Clonostachys rosea]
FGTTMDPFQKLPVEARLGILVLTKDLNQCLSLSRASPAMFKVYSHHVDYIKRRHTQNILLDDDSLVQDFMAVILFPEADVTKCTPAERVASVEKHLDTWGAKQLPNPFLTPYNREGRRSLLALYDRILLLLGCVREYVLNCYGAVISEVLKTPVPKCWETQIYENAPKVGARRFWDVPKTCSLDTDQEDMGELDFAGWSDLPFSFMASCGFDLLTDTLLGSIGDFRELALQLCEQLVHNLPYLEGTSVHATVDYDNCTLGGI